MTNSSFNWNDLRYFLAIARTQSSTEAARQLGVDDTTVRRRIAALEHDLVTRLLEPRDRGFVLTPEGDRLLQFAESIESLTLRVEDNLKSTNRVLAGNVRVGAPDGIATYFLAPRLARFNLEHPALDLQLVAMSRQFNLSNREADIAILMTRPTSGRQVVRKLSDCVLFLCAAPEYLASAPPIETIADLQHHSFVGYVEDLIFAPGLNYSPPQGVPARYRFTSTSLAAQFQATVAGGGICLLPRYLTHGSPLVRILPDQVRVEREVWISVHSDLKDLARYRAVTKFIHEEVAAHQDLFLE